MTEHSTDEEQQQIEAVQPKAKRQSVFSHINLFTITGVVAKYNKNTMVVASGNNYNQIILVKKITLNINLYGALVMVEGRIVKNRLVAESVKAYTVDGQSLTFKDEKYIV